MAMSTCGDPITMSPQALQPQAVQTGHAGTANQIVMVIERKSGVEKPCRWWQILFNLQTHAGVLCAVLQGRNNRGGGVHLLSTTGPTGHSGTSRVIPVIYTLQRTEELKCICNINNSNGLIFLYWGAGRVQWCFRKRMGVASEADPSYPCGSD